jgi:Tol biopolymer transport system component
VLPSVSATGRLVFASHTYSTGIWEMNLPKTAGEQAAGLRRVIDDNALNYRPSVSADGTKLVWISDRTGTREVWEKDLISMQEFSLTPKAPAQNIAAISRDGKQIAYWDGSAIYTAPAAGGASRLICRHCGRPDDWTHDGKIIAGRQIEDDTIAVIDPATGVSTKIITHPSLRLAAPSLSPDGKWMAFHVTDGSRPVRQIFVAPYTGQPVAQAEWIAITDGKGLDREARWSADGSQIYFLSDRDGFRCIWSRKVDPVTKHPRDDIYPLVHFHDSRLSLLHVPNTGHVSLCAVHGKLIFAMGELTSNLWETDIR